MKGADNFAFGADASPDDWMGSHILLNHPLLEKDTPFIPQAVALYVVEIERDLPVATS